MRYHRLVLFGVLLAIAGSAYAFVSRRPIAVTVATVRENVPVRVFGLGTVEAQVISRIGFEVGAGISELNADHGDVVNRGRVLARLRDTQQNAKVARARAIAVSAEVAVKRAGANVVKARAILAQRIEMNRRRQQLVDRQVTSAQSAEEAQRDEEVAKAELLVAESDVDVAKAQLTDARAQLDYETAILDQHVLLAPFDAIVVDRQKELGTVIKAGDPIFTLAAVGSFWVLAYVDEARAGAIAVGQPAEVRLRSLPNQEFAARVVRVGIESDRITEERRVYVRCEQCPVQVHLGEQAEVLITVANLQNARLVPEAAVTGYDGAKGTVWSVENGRLSRRLVSLGHRTEDARIEIRDGLPRDAAVVTRVSPSLQEGRNVRASPESKP